MILALLALVPVGGDGPVDFGRDVLPILSEYCFDCHGPDAAARKGDLRLDVHDDVLFVVEPGAPEESELLARLVHENPKRLMPPPSTGKAPTAAEREVLWRWIEEGVAWAGHWSFEPVEAPLIPAMSLPSGELTGWDQDPLDLLVLHRLGEQGMSPSPPADPANTGRSARRSGERRGDVARPRPGRAQEQASQKGPTESHQLSPRTARQTPRCHRDRPREPAHRPPGLGVGGDGAGAVQLVAHEVCKYGK